MADYVQTTFFGPKDALSTGDPLKIIKGTEFDGEFGDISDAIATKYDINDIASQAQAEAETVDTVLITPLKLANWADYNAGIVGDLQAKADPNADQLFGWDDSAGAAIGFTLGTGLAFDGTAIDLSFLGFEALVDPNADRIAFWDDSAGAFAWLTASTGLTISGTNITTNDSAIVHNSLSGYEANRHIDHSAVSITAGTGMSGGGTIAATRTLNLDISGLTALSSGLAGTDGFLVDDNGTMKRMSVNGSHLPARDVAASGNFASTDVGGIVYWTGTSGTLTMPTGVGQDDCAIVVINSGSSTLTIAGSGVTITSANSLVTLPPGGVGVLIRETSTVWFLGGNIQ